MPLRLYNTMTREKADFAPLNKADVRLYVCGPTVSGEPHLGHGRFNVVWDILRPERDLVRADGADDPAGGALCGADDVRVLRLRRAARALPV